MALGWVADPVTTLSNVIDYVGGRFLANSSFGYLKSSVDGVMWEDIAVPAFESYGFAYGAGTFVSVAPGKIFSSPDGTTWTARTEPLPQFWADVTYGAGLFVAVAEGSTRDAMTSPDGISWTRRALPTSLTDYSAVAYSGSMFVAVAAYGSLEAASSPTGLVWTRRVMPVSADWRGLAYGAGVFVAVAYNNDKAATSADGITWILRTLPFSDRWSAVTFADGLFIAIARDTGAVITSVDGVAWATASSLPTLPSVPRWLSVAGDNSGTVVAVGSSELRAISAPPSAPPTPPAPTPLFWQTLAGTSEIP